eukprot:CAMPEP_0202979464 /NCGR_PEP_ID=MMETSP1396-20130829/85600_1 /ASSEMBLY_ACC=CAM_ASM_000872 /TAXON_ID= /ORGANISM="Pseudokeronopsis sp., Strain Brazil" /LENGTH=56 /DNA_ID=CAMNT_0049718889 /DNA_START=1057 /DNA_END=1227 /DNA_ORIENTATION=-
MSPQNIAELPEAEPREGEEEGDEPEDNIHIRNQLDFFESLEPKSNIGIFKESKEPK